MRVVYVCMNYKKKSENEYVENYIKTLLLLTHTRERERAQKSAENEE